MSDARWLDVADDVADAAMHFANAQALYASGRFEDPGLDGYRDGMALMHALQADHTSAEAALLRVLRMLGEKRRRAMVGIRSSSSASPKPTAAPTHGRRCCRRRLPPISTRRAGSAITRCGIAAASTRLAEPSLEAAQRLCTALGDNIERFKATVDPDGGSA